MCWPLVEVRVTEENKISQYLAYLNESVSSYMDDTHEQVAVKISIHIPVSTHPCHYQAGLEQLLLGTRVAGSRKLEPLAFLICSLPSHYVIIRLD